MNKCSNLELPWTQNWISLVCVQHQINDIEFTPVLQFYAKLLLSNLEQQSLGKI